MSFRTALAATAAVACRVPVVISRPTAATRDRAPDHRPVIARSSVN